MECSKRPSTKMVLEREGAPRDSLLGSSMASAPHTFNQSTAISLTTSVRASLLDASQASLQHCTATEVAEAQCSLDNSYTSKHGYQHQQNIRQVFSDVFSDFAPNLRPNAMHYNWQRHQQQAVFQPAGTCKSSLCITRSSVWDLSIRSYNALLAMPVQAATSYRLHQEDKIRKRTDKCHAYHGKYLTTFWPSCVLRQQVEFSLCLMPSLCNLKAKV